MSITLERDKSFTQILKQAAQNYPMHKAIVFGDKSRTYYELSMRVNRLSNALKQIKIGKCDRGAVISRNCIQYLEIEFALFQIGAVSVKVNWRMTVPEIVHLLKQNRVTLAFLDTGII